MIDASFVASLLFKVTLALLLALGAARLARRSRAAVRHVLLATGFAALIVLPIASLVVRPVLLVVPIAARIVESSPAALTFLEASEPPGPAKAAAAATAGTIEPQAVSTSALLVGTWAAGVLVFVLPVFVGFWQMRSLRKSGLPWPEGREIVRQLIVDAGIHRRVDVMLHEAISGPVTCGFLRPALVLPVDARGWNDDDLRRAIVHELEHVRRGDWATQCLARLLCAAYWCHPLAWIAWRRLGLEAERACDDAVLRRAEATSYADQLVVLAQRLSADSQRPLLAMANRADLTARVRAVLDSAQARGRAGMVCVALTLAIAALLVTAMAPLHAVLGAQSAPGASASPSFEVASIRRNTSGANEQFFQREPGGRFSVRNMPLRTVITFAYQIQPFQLKGGPDWLTSDRFDIVAKADGEPPLMTTGAADPLRLMLRKLLADRFKLVAREETQELPVFDLVLANRDGKTGPQLRRSETDCAAQMAAAMKARSGGAPPAPPGPNSPMRCGVTIGPGTIRFGGNPLSALANSLAPLVQRVVIDRTGLTGAWDFELTYTPEPGQGLLGPLPPGVERPPIDPNGPSLFTALEEQLGLKLNAARGPVTVIVIDSVEQPTPD